MNLRLKSCPVYRHRLDQVWHFVHGKTIWSIGSIHPSCCQAIKIWAKFVSLMLMCNDSETQWCIWVVKLVYSHCSQLLSWLQILKTMSNVLSSASIKETAHGRIGDSSLRDISHVEGRDTSTYRCAPDDDVISGEWRTSGSKLSKVWSRR